MLCGGGANLRDLDNYLKEKIGMNVETANPLRNIKNKEIISRAEALSYCTVIGLGLKDFYL